MIERQCLGEITHYGIPGMHWGVRRSPEQLGLESGNGRSKVEKSGNSVTMNGEFYQSGKGFVVHPDKIHGFCLNPKSKHAKEFFDDGYTEADGEKLFHDLEEGFDLKKKIAEKLTGDGNVTTYTIPMELGVTSRRLYTTAWMNDGPDGQPRLVTAYVDRRLKKED